MKHFIVYIKYKDKKYTTSALSFESFKDYVIDELFFERDVLSVQLAYTDTSFLPYNYTKIGQPYHNLRKFIQYAQTMQELLK